MSCYLGKTLVVYYSRTGRCERIAHALGSLLDCDIERLQDKSDYTGKKGLFLCATKAIFRLATQLKPTKFDPAYYDDVIVVTPIWAGRSCPAARTYIAARTDKFSRLTLVTCGGLSSKKGVRHEISKDYGVELQDTLGLCVDDVDNDIFKQHLRTFVHKAQDMTDSPPCACQNNFKEGVAPSAQSPTNDCASIDITIDHDGALAHANPKYGSNPYYAYPSNFPEESCKENEMKNTDMTSNVNPATKNSTQGGNAKANSAKSTNSVNNAQNSNTKAKASSAPSNRNQSNKAMNPSAPSNSHSNSNHANANYNQSNAESNSTDAYFTANMNANQSNTSAKANSNKSNSSTNANANQPNTSAKANSNKSNSSTNANANQSNTSAKANSNKSNSNNNVNANSNQANSTNINNNQ